MRRTRTGRVFFFKNDCLMNASGCKFNRFMIFKKAAHYVQWREMRERSGLHPRLQAEHRACDEHGPDALPFQERLLHERQRLQVQPLRDLQAGHATNTDRSLFLFKNDCFMNVSGCKFNRFMIFKKAGRFSGFCAQDWLANRPTLRHRPAGAFCTAQRRTPPIIHEAPVLLGWTFRCALRH